MRRFIIYAVVLFLLSPAAAMGVDVGEKAVSLRGSSTRGEIKLSDYLGNKHVILALYFRAFTPV